LKIIRNYTYASGLLYPLASCCIESKQRVQFEKSDECVFNGMFVY